MNKIYKIVFIIFITITVIFSTSIISFADDDDDEREDEIELEESVEDIKNFIEENKITESKENNNSDNSANEASENTNEVSKNKDKPTINSRRYVIYDRASKLPIYGKDENKQTAMASTTKILTAILTLEKCKNLNEEITIESKAANVGGSRLKLNTGDKITINDLLYGLLLRSGNDTAVALAIHIGGSIEGFAKLMNEKAEELGLKNSHFVTPHGLDDPEHYTTAVELAKLTDYALKNTKFVEIVRTKKATININGIPREISNTNEILCSDVEGVYGVKTGFTNNAGRCLVTSVKRNNMDLIIVVLMADTRKDRAKDTIKLIDYAFKTYRIENIKDKVNEEFDMWQKINENRIFVYKASSQIQTKLDNIEIEQIVTNQEIKIEINSITYLEAPVMENTKIGTVVVKNGENIIENIDILIDKTVNKKGIMDYITMFGKALVL